jgi:hypothetical protein
MGDEPKKKLMTLEERRAACQSEGEHALLTACCLALGGLHAASYRMPGAVDVARMMIECMGVIDPWPPRSKS